MPKFSKETLKEQLNIRKKAAEELLSNEGKLETFLKKLEQKLKSVPEVGEMLANVAVFISLIRAYVSGEYKNISHAKVALMVGACIYVASPIDLIPDTIPVIGWIDDAAIVGYVLKEVIKDVAAYKEYRDGLAPLVEGIVDEQSLAEELPLAEEMPFITAQASEVPVD